MTKYILSIALLITCVSNSFSQEEEDNIGTEVINVVKPYAPSVSDAFKIKEIPVVMDSTDLKKKTIKYKIHSIPVASTFTPSKGKAATVEKQRAEKLYSNYASLGLGNYLNVLGELYLTHTLKNNANVSLGLNHHSTQGEIKNVQLDDKFYDTNIALNYQKNEKELSYKIGAIFAHQQYNWYGTSYSLTDAERANIDAGHTYLTGGLNGSLQIENSIFKSINFQYLRFWDNQNAAENHLNLNPEFVMDKAINIKTSIDYLGGIFDVANADEKFGHLELGVHPSYAFEVNDFKLNLGIQMVFSSNDQADKTEFLIYPKIEVSYPVLDTQVIAFTGIDGGSTDNSYHSFAQKNTYVAPLLQIENTHKLYDFFAGIKGKMFDVLQYTIQASYKKEDHKAFYKMNAVNNVNTVTENYQKANTFGLEYDAVNTTTFYGKITADVSKNNTIGLSVNYATYQLDMLQEAWNTPNLKASVFGSFQFNEKLSGGLDVFYVGERKDQLQSNTILVAPALATLDDYMDINLHIDYQVTPRFTAFLIGNNLARENYQKYLSYPVQQIQVLGGIKYKFDF